MILIIFSCSSTETPMLSKASRVPQSGQICVLGYFLERAGTPPYCAPQSGQVRSIVALSDFICNPPAVVQRCEKNTLIKTKIAVTLKAGSHIRTARQTQRTLFVHDVHESRPAHCLARKVPYRQFDFGLVVEGWETLINIKPFLIGGFDCPDCNRDFRSHLWFNRNPKLGAVFDCIPCKDKRPELFARFIRNNTEGKGQLFTDIDELGNFPDYPKLIEKYNDSLYSGHRPESDLMLEHNQVFINSYKLDTCKVIKKLQELAESGIENYSDDVNSWLISDDYEIDCEEKKGIITRIFSESKVGVIYGSAGVGKSTLINHVSHYLNDADKLYLTQTNPAKENLMRKVDAENTFFSTIESFMHQDSSFAKYKLLVIDECSTVSNKDMVEVLQKANFEMLLLVGDTYQIDAIQFGNWFSVLKSFLPASAVFELIQPHRTKDERLLELWDKVRHMEDTAKEVIERESYSLKVDETLLSQLKPGEAILCLNYDGLYGINNINRFLQESNPNPAITWDIQQYKVGDPILFLDSDRFRPIIHNNMKGIIQGVEIIDEGTTEERIQFDIEIPKLIFERDVLNLDLKLLKNSEKEEKSLIRFYVHKLKSADEDGEDSRTVVPFQIAYAVSIHKAQGLEYDSVKIVITDEVEELVTHNIFYTAITRAREKLRIYWTPEVEEKVIRRIKPRDISKDVEILKTYLV